MLESANKNTFEQRKEYLRGYKLLQTKIRRLDEMAEMCPERAEHYIKQRDNARRLRDSIEMKIEQIRDGVLSEILFQKYICAKSFEQISYEMNYSRRQIERLHNKAILQL